MRVKINLEDKDILSIVIPYLIQERGVSEILYDSLYNEICTKENNHSDFYKDHLILKTQEEFIQAVGVVLKYLENNLSECNT